MKTPIKVYKSIYSEDSKGNIYYKCVSCGWIDSRPDLTCNCVDENGDYCE